MVDATRFIVEQLALVFDNSAEEQEEIAEVARAAVREDMGTGMDRDRFEDDLRSGRDHYDYVRAVGSAVAEKIGEIFDQSLTGVPEHVRGFVTSVLDLGSSETMDALGEHYLPESADDVFGEEDTDA